MFEKNHSHASRQSIKQLSVFAFLSRLLSLHGLLFGLTLVEDPSKKWAAPGYANGLSEEEVSEQVSEGAPQAKEGMPIVDTIL